MSDQRRRPGERWVVLGLAQVRAPWFTDVSRWAGSAQIPIEFLKCVGTADVRARLDGGPPADVLLLDGGAAGAGPELIDDARRNGVAVLVVTDAHVDRDWPALGAAAVLPDRFDADMLLDALRRAVPTGGAPDRPSPPHAVDGTTGTSAGADQRDAVERAGAPGDDATDVGRRAMRRPGQPEPTDQRPWTGTLVAVTGVRGSGASTLAMALAQGMTRRPGNSGSVVLADLAGRGDLGMYHDVGDVVPALQELVEAHRDGDPSRAEVRRHLFDIDERGYALLLGVRREQEWTALTARSIDRTLASLRHAFRCVVADVRCELEGEAETGSATIARRNAASRAAVGAADAVVVCGDASLKGLDGLVRAEHDVLRFGIEPGRIVRVVNRAPRTPRRRAEVTEALDRLGSPATVRVPPVFVPERRQLDVTHGAVAPFPAALVDAVTAAVTATVIDRTAAVDRAAATASARGRTEVIATSLNGQATVRQHR